MATAVQSWYVLPEGTLGKSKIKCVWRETKHWGRVVAGVGFGAVYDYGEEYGFYFCFVVAMFGALYFRPSYYSELQSAYLGFCKLGQHLL